MKRRPDGARDAPGRATPGAREEGNVGTHSKGRGAPSPVRATPPATPPPTPPPTPPIDPGSAADGDTTRIAANEAARRPSIEDEIRLRAYYRYLAREGAVDREGALDEEQGDDVSDWLLAEADVLGRRATGVDADSKVRGDAVP
jgi:hypothetical protein